jgi:hypothetical protein
MAAVISSNAYIPIYTVSRLGIFIQNIVQRSHRSRSLLLHISSRGSLLVLEDEWNKFRLNLRVRTVADTNTNWSRSESSYENPALRYEWLMVNRCDCLFRVAALPGRDMLHTHLT